jgi:hypothetical protein
MMTPATTTRRVVRRERYEKNVTRKPVPRSESVRKRVGQREVCSFLPIIFQADAGLTGGMK